MTSNKEDLVELEEGVGSSFDERRALVIRDTKLNFDDEGEPYMDIAMFRLNETESMDAIEFELDDEGMFVPQGDAVYRVVGESHLEAFKEMFGMTIEPGERKIMRIETYYTWE